MGAMLKRICLLLILVFTCGAETERWEGFWHYEGQSGNWLVIRNEEEFERFVERIPPTRVQQKQPAPPSDDPLLQRPPMDWEHYSLVAIWSHSIYIDCKILSTEREGDDLVLNMAYDAPAEDVSRYAQPLGIGQYCVARVERFPGEVKMGALNKKAPERRP